MPTLSHHQSTNLIKLLVLGDSKSGKTGALAPLVCAGYKLGILDMDNLLDPLRTFVERDCPLFLENVHYATFRDHYAPSAEGPVIKGQPKAFAQAIRLMDHWKTEDEDLGPPAEWGPDWIFVIDSFSRLCDAAYDFREPLTPRSQKSGQLDARATYGDAQDAMEKILANLGSDSFRTNVIVIGHLSYMTIQDPSGAEKIKAFPQGIGQKLSPKIPQYFPSVVHFYNHNGKRTLRTTSTPLLDLANPKPFEMSKEYPIETGLADFFRVLRDPPAKEAKHETQTQAQTPILRKQMGTRQR
jgi:hypothetical protein